MKRCFGLALAAWSVASLAQDAVDPVPPTATPVAAPVAPRPLWELGLGIAGLRLPDYRGADHSRTYALPLPYVVYRGQWLRADREGARALLLDTRRLELDISVGASVPARSRDNVTRAGMPDLPGTVEIGPNANIGLWRSGRYKLDLRLPVRAVVSLQRSPRHVGNTFSPNLNLDIANLAGGWHLGLQGGPLYGDRRYHAMFYGVDPAYATAQRAAYQAPGGYEGWRALAATSRRIGNVWLGGFVRYDNLRGAAFEDSPLVRRRSGVSFGFGASWVFATSSTMVAAPD